MAETIDRLVLTEARVIDPTQDLDRVATVCIASGNIAQLLPSATAPEAWPEHFKDAPTIDATGMMLLPGFIELRARLGEPGFEYKEDIESGLAAGAAGGYCRVCCLPDTSPVNDNRAITESLLQSASRTQGPVLGPIGAVTRGLHGDELAEIADMKHAGAVAVSDAGNYIEKADLFRRALQYCETFDVLLMQQPLEPSLARGGLMHEGSVSTRLGLRGSPGVAEVLGLQRDLALAATTQARYHACTLSIAESFEQIRNAKRSGVRVTCDVTPYHLLHNHTSLERYDSRYKLDPPLRAPSDQLALLEALNDGTVDCIVSDHRPQSTLDTDAEFDQVRPGISGIELTFSLLWKCATDGRIGLRRIAELLSTGPARVLGIPAPSFRPGALANFTLIDPSHRFVPRQAGMHSKSSNTPYIDEELQARVSLTVSEGRIIYTLKEEL